MTAQPYVLETDSRSRAVLSGHANAVFLARENEDGSILLTPGRVVDDAQYEYDTTPELQALLSEAAAAPRMPRRRRTR